MLCEHCGKPIADSSLFCEYCGSKVGSKPQAPAESAVTSCPHCGRAIAAGSIFCEYCGEKLVPSPRTPVRPAGMTCPHCGSSILAGSMFCEYCGEKVGSEIKAAPVEKPPRPARTAPPREKTAKPEKAPNSVKPPKPPKAPKAPKPEKSPRPPRPEKARSRGVGWLIAIIVVLALALAGFVSYELGWLDPVIDKVSSMGLFSGRNDVPDEEESYTTESDGTFTYKLYEDHAVVTGFVDKKMIAQAGIPEEFEDVPVTEIGAHAFDDCYALESISIPDSVSRISRSAFDSSSSLVMICSAGSAAAKYAEANGLYVEYTDAPSPDIDRPSEDGPQGNEPAGTEPELFYATEYTGSFSEYDKLFFYDASASSEIYNSSKKYYPATNAIDGKLSTSWQEDGEGIGVGEYLTLYFTGEEELKVLKFRLGYAKSQEAYEHNCRPRQLEISFSDGSSLIYEFPDGNKDYAIELSESVFTSFVRLTIIDAYMGSEWTDTCISEVTPFGYAYYGNVPEDYPSQDDEYIFPYSDCVYLEESDLYGLSDWECKIARNEIYARHGRLFITKELQDYFDSCSWYYGCVPSNEFSASSLNECETANIELITKYEKEHGYN